jgi:hypothetical protein
MWTKIFHVDKNRFSSQKKRQKMLPIKRSGAFHIYFSKNYFFIASSTATATETVIPTMGLLPAPRKPIISTWAGTEEEPAN